jgi:N-acetylglucosamine transport system substrate-binding protein
MGEFTLFEAAQSGLFQDLTPLFDFPVDGDDAGRTYRDLFTPSDLDMITVDGAIRVAPSDTGFEAWWYNKALFREKGWEVPKTWDEFLTLCEKIKAEGIAPLAYQGLYPTYMIWGYLLQAIAAHGGRQAYVDCMYLGAEDPWHSEAVRQAVQNLYDLSEKGYILDGTTALNHTEAQMEFLNGGLRLFPAAPGLKTKWPPAFPRALNWAFAPFRWPTPRAIITCANTRATLAYPPTPRTPKAA